MSLLDDYKPYGIINIPDKSARLLGAEAWTSALRPDKKFFRKRYEFFKNRGLQFSAIRNIDVYKRQVESREWEKLAATMAELAPVIAQFFNDVLVMDPDAAVRMKRIAQLKECQAFFMQIGDFSILK